MTKRTNVLLVFYRAFVRLYVVRLLARALVRPSSTDAQVPLMRRRLLLVERREWLAYRDKKNLDRSVDTRFLHVSS